MVRNACRSAATAALVALAACTPQAGLVLSLMPDGTIPIVLSNLQGVDEPNLRRISELERRGDWEGLARFAETNIARDRFSADWRTVAGYAYSRLGQHERAIESHAQAVRLAPDQMIGWTLLAQAYREAGQPARAVTTLERALLVRRDSRVMLYLLGEAYSDLGRLKSALGAYGEALQLDGEFAEAWFGMGRAYGRLGRTAEAEKVVQVLQRLNPGLASELSRVLSPRK